MQLFFHVTSGKKITLEVEPSDSIYSAKIQIQGKENIPAEQQRFSYIDGQEMDNCSVFSEYDMAAGSRVRMVITKPATIVQPQQKINLDELKISGLKKLCRKNGLDAKECSRRKDYARLLAANGF